MKQESCGTGRPRGQAMMGGGCCGKDFGPVRTEEMPQGDDLRRLNAAGDCCPKCKTDLFEDEESCPGCGERLAARAKPAESSRPLFVLLGLAGVLVAGLLIATVV